MSVNGATVVVVSAGYEGKRRIHARMAELGARLVIVDEPGHWSESLVAEGIASAWLPVTIVGDPDEDAAAVLEALARAGVQPDGVITFWEFSIGVAARVATSLGLPTNPVAGRRHARAARCARVSSPPSSACPRRRPGGSGRSTSSSRPPPTWVFPAVVKPEFGAGAVGCVRVDTPEGLPGVYTLARSAVDPTPSTTSCSGPGTTCSSRSTSTASSSTSTSSCTRGSASSPASSQNWPTAEPSFQETGLHCPPDFDRKSVARLVDLAVKTVQGFGLNRGVLHVEGKCTSRGPRLVEVNARMGGGRIHEYVRAVWDVDLVEAQLRNCLGLPPSVQPSRRPRSAVVDSIIYAPSTGRLAALPIDDAPRSDCQALIVDVDVEIGEAVLGPDAVFATALAEVTVIAKDLRTARSAMARVLRYPPRVE